MKKAITGTALALMFTAAAASAQTTYDTTAPGTPDTGRGDNAAMNALILGSSAALALAGASYMASRRKVS